MAKRMISIIIPVYNVEKYISKCLDSILGQSYKDYEIIIIIDGSKDKSEDIVKKKLKGMDNVIIVSRENRGILYTRLEGAVKYATGKYITYVDSDDWLEENALYDMIHAIDEDTDILKANFYEAYDDINKKEITRVKISTIVNNKEDLYQIFTTSYNMNNIYSQLINRNLFKDIDVDTSISMGDDLLINLNIYQKSKNIKFITNYLYNYRVNPTSITHISSYEKLYKNLQDSLKVYSYLNDFMKNNSSNKNYKNSCIKTIKEINTCIVRLSRTNIKDYSNLCASIITDYRIKKIINNINIKDILIYKCRHKFLIMLIRNQNIKSYCFICKYIYGLLYKIKKEVFKR